VIIVLNSCYSGGFAWDGTNEGDLAKDGRMVLTSSREDEYSYTVGSQGDTEWRERFTFYLIEGLKNGKTVEGAFQYAQETVTKTSQINMPQHPQIYDGVNPIKLNLDEIGTMLGIVTLLATSVLILVLIKNWRKPRASQPEITTSLTWPPYKQGAL
jgi:hypothetical protein